ncbi:hypothetical protein ACOSP7_006452 [Xanthoceras sorbifolium]
MEASFSPPVAEASGLLREMLFAADLGFSYCAFESAAAAVATALDATAAKYRPRERDRERAQARTGKGGKNKDDGLTPEQRRERDAKALQEKQAKKAGQAAAGGNAGGQTSNKK